MELRQLEYFIAVAEELHFSNAAKRLHMTQPPLSLQIKRLEEELELELFERTKRFVKMTPAGKMFYEQARAILEKVDSTKDLCQKTHTGEVGDLAIGLIPVALDLGIFNLIKKFRGQFPDVHLSLLEMGTCDQLTALRQDRISVGFVQVYEQDLPDLASKCVVSDTFWLAVPENHELAELGKIPLQALAGINLILPPPSADPGLMSVTVGSCRQAGFEPRVDLEVLGYHTALKLVAAGLGVTHVPRTLAKTAVDGVVFRPVSAPWPKMEIMMVWKPDDRNRALAKFVDTVGRRKSGPRRRSRRIESPHAPSPMAN